MNEVKLTHYGIDPNIVLPEFRYLTLVIESKELFYKYVNEFYHQIEEKSYEEKFVLIINQKKVPINQNVIGLFNLFDIDFNSKSIHSLLIRKFEDFLQNVNQFDRKANIETLITEIIEDFRFFSDISIDYDVQINANALAKISDLRISYDINKSLLEKICDYIDLMIELKNSKVVALMFGKKFLGKEQFHCLLNFCIDRNCRLINIEQEYCEKYVEEDIYIIDSDMSSIL